MKLRMQITKEKEIRFISHLEYVRTIERAIRRAKLPAAYSEGFNPHLKFSLASALGVGVVSMAEFVEIELAEPMEVHEAAEDDNALPRGIQIMAADVTRTTHWR
ncbi:MAG: TIGR03936 family radical SAM-associated protein [Phascolarctobacterium faecium]